MPIILNRKQEHVDYMLGKLLRHNEGRTATFAYGLEREYARWALARIVDDWTFDLAWARNRVSSVVMSDNLDSEAQHLAKVRRQNAIDQAEWCWFNIG